MDNYAQKLAELLELAKKNNLKKLKVGEIEFEFDEPAEKETTQSIGGEALDLDKVPNPTEDEMLFWSSGYEPEHRIDPSTPLSNMAKEGMSQ